MGLYFYSDKRTFSALVFVFLVFVSTCTYGSEASWISYPTANTTDYGVYHFRKTFNTEQLPESLIIRISADNRYDLFVNGQRVVYGPAAGDLQTYKYDEVDIAPYLIKGKNSIACKVFNGGKDKPMAFISSQTAFYLHSLNNNFDLSTNKTWLCTKNEAYTQITYDNLATWKWFYGFYACGGSDFVDASLYPWGWENTNFDDSKWKPSEVLLFDGRSPWNLHPRNIAFMDRHKVNAQQVRLSQNTNITKDFVTGDKPFTVAPHTSATVLLDFVNFTMGYPELMVSGGKNAEIKIAYAESLFEKVNIKAHRDSVNGKTMYGIWDVFRPDGNDNRIFRPLWKRAFRYVQLQITTQDQALTVQSFTNEYSGYPYPERSTFKSDNEKLNRIFDMCMRTFELCSADTYYDTPYHEQLSYGGDTRVVGNISFYNSTDDRLFKEMLRLYSQSQNQETGLFKSAYPSRFDFDMGSWSLAWIQSLNDYYNFRGDKAFVAGFVDKIENVLDFYNRHLDSKNGLIGLLNKQNFIDWSQHENTILPRKNNAGEFNHSAMMSMYYLYTLNKAIELYQNIGENQKAQKWIRIASKLKTGIYEECWNRKEGLFSDYPNELAFTPHTNILAILCDVIPPKKQSKFLFHVLNYKKFDEKVSSYFSFFLFKAFEKTGNENQLVAHLDFWINFLNKGMHTCGETGFASQDRSDCHAWSAHPALFMMRDIAGIRPDNIGFCKILIKPEMRGLSTLNASMPHPKGLIQVNYTIKQNKIEGTIVLPKGLSGKFSYKNQNISLKEGENLIQ